MKGFRSLSKHPAKILIVFSVLFVFLAVSFVVLNIFLTQAIQRNQIQSLPFKSQKAADYPLLRSGILPQISATGAIIMDADSKVVLYAKNPDLRFSLASTTKMMTGLTALDYFNPDDILTVKASTNEGSLIGLYEGEQMSFRNLLYAMFLPSANDAAFTIAQNFPGGQDEFVNKMNQKAKALELFNTAYVDPAGLLDEGDYTTPFDLARLASFFIQNKTLQPIVNTRQITIADTLGKEFELENLNKLLGFEGVNGIKTGYTEGAGQVLVTSKIEKGRTVIIVVMGSEDRFADTQQLLNLVSDNLNYLPIGR